MLISVVYYPGFELRLIDNFINLNCIIFMPKSMDKYYQLMCGENGRCCCCAFMTRKMIDHLELEARKRASIYRSDYSKNQLEAVASTSNPVPSSPTTVNDASA